MYPIFSMYIVTEVHMHLIYIIYYVMYSILEYIHLYTHVGPICGLA